MLESPSNPVKIRIIASNPKNFEPQNRMNCSTPRGWRHHPNANKDA